ncbi:MAG: hypothetical protein II060_03450 [Bacteroidales bacterium]|nr:hypothetical protein [Bacteroidales bacterium]
MELRHVTKEDLPKLAELISCEELATRDDISFDHSAVAIDDSGVILAFVIMRQRSLQDFFGGRIPDEIITEDDEDYMEGDEFIYRNETEEHFPEDIHYEMIYSYETENYYYVQQCFSLAANGFILIWRDNKNPNISETMKFFISRDFNGVISDYILEYD